VLVREQAFVDITVLEQHPSVTKQVEHGGKQGFGVVKRRDFRGCVDDEGREELP
jgi:hypothetical protein